MSSTPLDPRVLESVPLVPLRETYTAPERVSEIRRVVGDKLAAWAIDIGAGAVTKVRAEIQPTHFDLLGPLVAQAVEQQCLGLIAFLCGDRSALGLSRENRATIISGVREELPIYPSMVDGIRIVERIWKSKFIDLVVAHFHSAECAALLIQVDALVSRYFDRQIDETAALYSEEAARLFEGRVVSRRQLVDRILAGNPVDKAVASANLGIKEGANHYGFIAWTPKTSQHLLDFGAFTAAFKRTFEPWSVLTVPAEKEAIWLWVSGSTLELANVVAKVHGLVKTTPEVAVAIGGKGNGQSGFRMTHKMARAARTYGEFNLGAERVYTFRDTALMSLLTADPEAARWFVQQEIGPLLGSDQNLSDLRTTLLTLIQHGGRLIDTAETLFVHRNTVTYRLRRIRELLGSDPLQRPFETQAALILDRQLRD